MSSLKASTLVIASKWHSARANSGRLGLLANCYSVTITLSPMQYQGVMHPAPHFSLPKGNLSTVHCLRPGVVHEVGKKVLIASDCQAPLPMLLFNRSDTATNHSPLLLIIEALGVNTFFTSSRHA